MTRRLYLLAFVLAVSIGAALPWVYARVTQRPRAAAPVVHDLTPAVGVTEQIAPAQIAAIRRMGFGLLVALRPDGEAADQPAAADIQREAERQGLAFAYVPVPHGDIPPACVAALKRVLADHATQRTLLYCRTGRRAARTWGLAEADRPAGLDAQPILDAIAHTGQTADDLAAAIRQRVADRTKP